MHTLTQALFDRDMLEHLRRQADKVGALESKIAELERQRAQLQASSRQLEGQLHEYRQIKEEWDWFFEHSPDLLIVHGPDGRPQRVSPAVQRVLGYTPPEFMAIDMEDMLHPDDLARTREHIGAIARGMDGLNFESRCRHKDGTWRWLAWTTPAVRPDAPQLERTYAVGRDITLGKLTEQELLFRAQHDALTGLANRAAFDQALDGALSRAARSLRPVSLLTIDLDGFKAVNDTHGHPAGDAVLRTVAARLQAAQRKGDLVARLGGDEFAIVVEDADRAALDAMAARMLSSVCEPIPVGSVTVAVGCSIGIASWPADATDAAGLCARADRALYEVKSAGKRGVRHATP